jgi:hypothetical protein
VAHLPPVSTLFAAFLGYNPMQHLLGASVLAHLPAGHAAIIEGRSFFPNLISAPFRQGLHTAFDFAIVACLVAAGASWFRGGHYVHAEGEAIQTATDLPALDPPAMDPPAMDSSAMDPSAMDPSAMDSSAAAERPAS